MYTKTEAQAQVQRPLAVPTSREVQTIKGKTYVKFVFFEGLDFKGAVKFENVMKLQGYEMIGIEEAREIRGNTESNRAFKNVLEVDEWTYIHDENSESKSLAASVVHFELDRWLYVGDYGWPDGVSRVVVLKKLGSEAATPQEQTEEASKLLRQADMAEDALSRLSGNSDDKETVRKLVKMIREPSR